MSKLAAFLGRAIPTQQQKLSSHLGDRTGYVGASDIAGCPRKSRRSQHQRPERIPPPGGLS